MDADGIKLLNLCASLQVIADELDTEVKHTMFWADEVTTDHAGLLEGLRLRLHATAASLYGLIDQI